MKTRLLKKWRKNWVISLNPAVFENEEDKYYLHDWNKPNDGEIVVAGTLKDCLNYEHKILMRYLDDYEKRSKNTICNKLN